MSLPNLTANQLALLRLLVSGERRLRRDTDRRFHTYRIASGGQTFDPQPVHLSTGLRLDLTGMIAPAEVQEPGALTEYVVTEDGRRAVEG